MADRTFSSHVAEVPISVAICNNERKALHELLAMASNDQGATLLIPALRRPYVWGPASVRLLIG